MKLPLFLTIVGFLQINGRLCGSVEKLQTRQKQIGCLPSGFSFKMDSCEVPGIAQSYFYWSCIEFFPTSGRMESTMSETQYD